MESDAADALITARVREAEAAAASRIAAAEECVAQHAYGLEAVISRMAAAAVVAPPTLPSAFASASAAGRTALLPPAASGGEGRVGLRLRVALDLIESVSEACRPFWQAASASSDDVDGDGGGRAHLTELRLRLLEESGYLEDDEIFAAVVAAIMDVRREAASLDEAPAP